MEKLTYKLDTFEGPLDLLLFLIRKNKVSVREVRITELVDQYLEQIDALQAQSMELSSEFLEMAAKLVYLKTVSLLPEPEEEAQISHELTGRLLEYDECRRAAESIGRRIRFDSFVRSPEPIRFDRSYREAISPDELGAAYLSAVGRGKRFLPPKPEAFSGIVSHRIVSVASRIVGVLRSLRRCGAERYEELYRDCRGRSELVATFLAVLELVKGKRIRLEGKHDSVVKLVERQRKLPGRGEA